jgi:hypothetical protein
VAQDGFEEMRVVLNLLRHESGIGVTETVKKKFSSRRINLRDTGPMQRCIEIPVSVGVWGEHERVFGRGTGDLLLEKNENILRQWNRRPLAGTLPTPPLCLPETNHAILKVNLTFQKCLVSGTRGRDEFRRSGASDEEGGIERAEVIRDMIEDLEQFIAGEWSYLGFTALLCAGLIHGVINHAGCIPFSRLLAGSSLPPASAGGIRDNIFF